MKQCQGWSDNSCHRDFEYKVDIQYNDIQVGTLYLCYPHTDSYVLSLNTGDKLIIEKAV